MKTSELFEQITDRLNGYLDVPTLAKMLPDIDNVANFEEALDKIRLGQGAYLTIPEKMQLALAFISLIGLTAPQKSQVLRVISAVQAAPTPKNTSQPAQENPQNDQNIG